MLFHNLENLLRILIVGFGSYAGLVILLRISGNRTLSKMNSFDFVVTVALGSTLSSGILQKTTPLAETLFAFTLLISFQYVVTWMSVRSKWINRLVKSEPQLLFNKGQFLDQSMRKSRVTEDEIRASVREQGISSIDQVETIILETNGELSVTRR